MQIYGLINDKPNDNAISAFNCCDDNALLVEGFIPGELVLEIIAEK